MTVVADLELGRAELLGALHRADRPGALRLMSGLLDAGVDPVDLLVDVVAPTQRAIGDRWLRGEYTVAQEHAATAISEAAVGVIAGRVPEPKVPAGYVVVACAEREWHALAARIVTEVLRCAGWRTTFLGASTPARQLSGYLDRLDPDAVAVSCSVPAGLPAARHIIEAAAESGIPTLAGGQAFGPDDRRATALGASGWAASPRDAARVLTGLAGVVPHAQHLIHAGADEFGELSIQLPELTGVLTGDWLEVVGRLDAGEAERLRPEARDAVGHVLQSLGGALLTDDGSVLWSSRSWLETMLAARGCGPETVGSLWTLLRDRVGITMPVADRMLRTGPGG